MEEVIKLIVTGKASIDDCSKQWDAIIQKNYETNGGYEYMNYVDLMKEYGYLMYEYNFVKCCLLKLITLNQEVGIVFMPGEQNFVQDDEIIAELLDHGYKINTTGANAFCQSINSALIRVDGLANRMKLKAAEIIEMMDGSEKEPASFDSIMAFLSSQFPHVPEDITLSRYNEMIKVLKKKNKPQVQPVDND